MKSAIVVSLLALCIGAAQAAAPAEAPTESCEQIRAQIKAHTGTPAKPNTALLGKVGMNRKCRFTSTEAYRAAWGDKPMPPDERRVRRAKQRAGDDD